MKITQKDMKHHCLRKWEMHNWATKYFKTHSFNLYVNKLHIRNIMKSTTPTASFYLSMKRPAVHTFVSNRKHRPGSDCTCWATALQSFPHRSLSSSPERQQPRPTAVQQPPSRCWSIAVPPSPHPRHINFLGK